MNTYHLEGLVPNIIENNDESLDDFCKSAASRSAHLATEIVLTSEHVDALLSGKCIAVVDDTTSILITLKDTPTKL